MGHLQSLAVIVLLLASILIPQALALYFSERSRTESESA